MYSLRDMSDLTKLVSIHFKAKPDLVYIIPPFFKTIQPEICIWKASYKVKKSISNRRIALSLKPRRTLLAKRVP
jgi:hypothetical protein